MPPTTAQHESDSEDLDFVPGGEDHDSDSDNSDERNTKRPRVGLGNPPQTQEELAIAQSERQALWAKFQASVGTPTPTAAESRPKRMVKMEKRYRFAGEDVVEIVEVPEDSKDAKNWPLWEPSETVGEVATFNNDSSSASTPPAAGLPTASSSSSVTTTQQVVNRRPGRRKPRVQLAELPSADSRKGKKLTTLEKSTLDWNAHVNVPGEPELAAELEANRRGGGYLERVEFLQRVDDRKNQALEASRDRKRRRG
ncbi:bucentaur or craniofacial development-domain-containing protein [Lactarius deliciosus]|nr:bucentaur or craniofacial development-domain-containing protein [Lactarius deliciosus]